MVDGDAAAVGVAEIARCTGGGDIGALR